MNTAIYPKDTLVVNRVRNGFIVKAKGTRENQEDNLDGVYVFKTPRGLWNFIYSLYPDMDPVGFEDIA
jgi:hypothetical protein